MLVSVRRWVVFLFFSNEIYVLSFWFIWAERTKQKHTHTHTNQSISQGQHKFTRSVKRCGLDWIGFNEKWVEIFALFNWRCCHKKNQLSDMCRAGRKRDEIRAEIHFAEITMSILFYFFFFHFVRYCFVVNIIVAVRWLCVIGGRKGNGMKGWQASRRKGRQCRAGRALW